MVRVERLRNSNTKMETRRANCAGFGVEYHEDRG